MDDPCQFADECPAFAHFSRMPNNVNLEVYCQGDFGSCKRRQLHMSGQPVPSNLAPYGGRLSTDAERPRTIL